MVHSRGSVFHRNGLPGIAAQIEIEYHGGGFSRGSVNTYAAVVVNSRAAAGEICALVLVRAAGRNPVARVTRMRRKFGPRNFLGVLVVDLADPAFAGSHIAGLGTGGTFHGAINIDDRIFDYRSRQAEHRRAG